MHGWEFTPSDKTLHSFNFLLCCPYFASCHPPPPLLSSAASVSFHLFYHLPLCSLFSPFLSKFLFSSSLCFTVITALLFSRIFVCLPNCFFLIYLPQFSSLSSSSFSIFFPVSFTYHHSLSPLSLIFLFFPLSSFFALLFIIFLPLFVILFLRFSLILCI